jgi:hypothetical protein
MISFAQIAVNVPSVTGVFDYALPPELEVKIGAEHLVSVSSPLADTVIPRYTYI